LALLWSTTGRFGAPVAGAAGPAAGKLTLIENTAELMRSGGHAGFALERYLQLSVQEVARRTHAPAHVEPRAWIAHLEKAHRVRHSLDALERDARAAPREAALAVAARIHRWRQEMIDGSVRDPVR